MILMTDKEIKRLIELIGKLKSSRLLPPKMPYEVWMAIQSIVPLPSVEVVITQNGKNFLLVYRKDQYWNGWHIPGGFLLYKESPQEACQRLAKKEVGIKVNFKSLITAYMWPDHPYGSPLSLVCLCTSKEKPKEGKFFSKIPSPMIPHHGDFIKEFLLR